MNPLKQGLKLACRYPDEPVYGSLSMNPLKQGLKQSEMLAV